MAYHITVLEPGKKKVRLYAGNGATTSLLIYAVQYAEEWKEALESWVQELNRDNPGYAFALRKIPERQNIVER
jgi:hypothetical protein